MTGAGIRQRMCNHPWALHPVMRCNFHACLYTAPPFTRFEKMLDHFYDPNRLLAALAHELKINTDKKLAKTLGFSAGIIAGLRAGRISMTATMYLQIQEKTGLTLQALQALSGDRRRRLRPSGSVAPATPRHAGH